MGVRMRVRVCVCVCESYRGVCKFLFNLQHVKKAGHECVRVCECVCGCVCLCMHIIIAFLARSDTESETKQYKTE